MQNNNEKIDSIPIELNQQFSASMTAKLHPEKNTVLVFPFCNIKRESNGAKVFSLYLPWTEIQIGATHLNAVSERKQWRKSSVKEQRGLGLLIYQAEAATS